MMQLNMRLFDLLLTVDPDGSIYSMEWKDQQIDRFPGTALRLLSPRWEPVYRAGHPAGSGKRRFPGERRAVWLRPVLPAGNV